MTVAQAGPTVGPPPQQPPPTEDAILAALTLLALTPDLPEPQLLAGVQALLAPLGIGADAARSAALLAFVGVTAIELGEQAGVAERFVARTSPARRAAYTLNAARRIEEAHGRVEPQMRAAESLHGVGDEADAQKVREQAARDARYEDRERQFLAQHLAAERTRQAAAQHVDRLADRFGPVLGWKARLDERTTPECRAAHGKNFRADRPPAIGWPGTLHGGTCRCVATGPFNDAPVLG